MVRYGESGFMGVWVTGPPRIRVVERALWVDIVRKDPWVLGPFQDFC